MAIAYHIDRSNNLFEGKVLDLFDIDNQNLAQGQLKLIGLNKISHFAIRCSEAFNNMLNGKLEHINNLNNYEIERNFESFRKLISPNSISRLQCIYALEKLSDIALWSEYFSVDKYTPIYTIHYDSDLVEKFDARHLIGGFGDPYPAMIHSPRYWNHDFSENPLPELLIPLPVKIGERISYSDF